MLHVLHVDNSRGEVLEIMHDQLFLVGDEHGDSMLLRKKLQASLSHLCTLLDLLEAG